MILRLVFIVFSAWFLNVSLVYAQIEGLDEPIDNNNELNFETDESTPKSTFTQPWESSVLIRDERAGEIAALSFGGRALSGANGMEIFIFDLGQADSALIVGPSPERRSLLIDLGKSKSPGKGGKWSYEHVGQRIYDILGKFEVDYALITHFHSDHLGYGDYGFLGLMDKSAPAFKVGTLIDTGDMGEEYLSTKNLKKRKAFSKRVSKWIRKGQLDQREQPLFGASQIDLGGSVIVEMATFAGRTHPEHGGVHEDYAANHAGHYDGKGANENDLSIGVKVIVGDFEFWTAGDLSGASGRGTSPLSGSGDGYTNVEWPLVQYLEENNIEADVEVYRANHHGSRYSTSKPLLKALDPEFVIYSAGEASYNHPSASVVKNVQYTARQFATSMDEDAWPDPSDFAKYKGEIGDEIHIMVSKDGGYYKIEDRVHRSYNDRQEAEDADKGEEDRPLSIGESPILSGLSITPNMSSADAQNAYRLLTEPALE